jgi:hypothetical protein
MTAPTSSEDISDSYIFVIQLDDPEQIYHNGMRVTTGRSIREIACDLADFVYAEAGDEKSEEERAILSHLAKAENDDDLKAFTIAASKLAAYHNPHRMRPWTLYSPKLGYVAQALEKELT